MKINAQEYFENVCMKIKFVSKGARGICIDCPLEETRPKIGLERECTIARLIDDFLEEKYFNKENWNYIMEKWLEYKLKDKNI